ncbi:DUF6920 family protein [Aquimarina sediminis]|uniref:DUF6920 family protein n=1 Tax=Aquimarina sediminis TaxID=2070536 RepID=UPI000CA07B20|nr:DUF6544 family protein [Aquimarina sediminis]
MRIVLIIIIGLHGIIHSFGFLQAFDLTEFNAISQPISKTYGLFWFLAFLLFAITIILILFQYNYWWFSVFLAIAISQALIFHYWSDTKFGTIANAIILLATILRFSNFNFEKKIKEERKTIFESSQLKSQETISEKSLNDLPLIVQKWLNASRVIGNQYIYNVYLTQELQLKLNPEQENWSSGKAEQYFTIQPPAFNWNIITKMNSIVSVVGRDKFNDGKGEMMIKLLSLIPVANAKSNKKINQATLQRYLAEIVWFPSASLSQYIKWETIDDYSAMATMEYNGTRGSGKFYFDENGNFKKFVAMRYQDSNKSEPTKWTVIATRIEELNGIKIPTECEASWELERGKWTWLKLKITDIRYNIKEMPLTNNI